MYSKDKSCCEYNREQEAFSWGLIKKYFLAVNFGLGCKRREV